MAEVAVALGGISSNKRPYVSMAAATLARYGEPSPGDKLGVRVNGIIIGTIKPITPAAASLRLELAFIYIFLLR